MSETTIGLIGFGAIGREVAAQLAANSAGSLAIVALDRSTPNDAPAVRFVQRAAELIAARPSLMIEAAGHAAVSEHVVTVLKAGIPVLLASVGSLADDDLRTRVEAAAAEGKTDLILPGGAVGGVDYLRTIARSANLKVRYCSRKPIAAWAKELAERGHALDKIDSEIVLFEGSAREAAMAFLQNLNVAMTLALAGPGVDAIAVRVVADFECDGQYARDRYRKLRRARPSRVREWSLADESEDLSVDRAQHRAGRARAFEARPPVGIVDFDLE